MNCFEKSTFCHFQHKSRALLAKMTRHKKLRRGVLATNQFVLGYSQIQEHAEFDWGDPHAKIQGGDRQAE